MPIQISQNGNVALPEGRTPEGDTKIINMPDAVPGAYENEQSSIQSNKVVGLPKAPKGPSITNAKLYTSGFAKAQNAS